jgi:predicted nuclease of predicted toxin-antitoxin system
MRVKLDENIPVRLAGELSPLGHDVDTVASEGLKGKPDSDVWSAARREERFLITQDLDFSDVPSSSPERMLDFSSCGFVNPAPMR